MRRRVADDQGSRERRTAQLTSCNSSLTFAELDARRIGASIRRSRREPSRPRRGRPWARFRSHGSELRRLPMTSAVRSSLRSRSTLFFVAAFASLATPRRAGRLRQHRRHRHAIHRAALLPGVTVTITSVERKTVDTVVTERVRPLSSRSGCCPARTRSRPSCRASRRRSCPNVRGQRRHADATSTSSSSVGAVTESVEVTGGSPAAQDRPRRRGDDLRSRSSSPSCRCSIATSPSSSC